MDWTETTASYCRYSGVAKRIWGDWDILWEHSYATWQGEANFFAKKGHRYCAYSWAYGSCSGCDAWEAAGLTDKEIEAAMRKGAMWITGKEALKRWLEMLESTMPTDRYEKEWFISDGLLDRINAIRKELNKPKIKL